MLVLFRWSSSRELEEWPLVCASFSQQMTLTKQIKYQQQVSIALPRGTNPSASGLTIRNAIQSRANTGHGFILIAGLGTKEVPLADDKGSEYYRNKQDPGIWNHLGVVVNWLLGAY
jgi:hypothetical protein